MGREVFVGGGQIADSGCVYGSAVVGRRGWQRWGGHRCCRIGLIDGQGETRSYEIVSPSRPRGRRTLPVAVAVAVAEAKKESWAQNCEGSKKEREDKL